MNRVTLQGINKHYGTLHVLKDINLSLDTHCITTISGPSGAGKSTLLQIMGTLDTPDTGTVSYDDVQVTRLNDTKLSRFRGRNIGFIFQEHQLLPEFTALENVMLPTLLAGAGRRTAREKALELLTDLGLRDRLRHKPSALSGGERQRVAIARALVNGPALIFADEPTGSLDSHNRDEIKALFLNLHQSRRQGFVIVTHDDTLAGIGHVRLHMADGMLTQSTHCNE